MTNMATTPKCRVYWGTHGCDHGRGHDGDCECDCCECIDHPDPESGCVAKPPYYGPDTRFYGDDVDERGLPKVELDAPIWTFAFEDCDWFAIKGVGMAFSFTKPEGFKPSDFKERDVLVDGGKFRVRGVEKFLRLHETSAAEPISLLVRPLDATAELVLVRAHNTLGKHRPR